MHIQRIALKNFKCFKEVAVDFSRITLLTGENSSGKSSLIYGILAPLQSINPSGNSFPFYLSLNGKYVNMGGFEEVTFNHNLRSYLGIELTLSFYDDLIYYFNTSWCFDTLSKSHKLDYVKIVEPDGQVEIKQKEDLSYIITAKPKNDIKGLNNMMHWDTLVDVTIQSASDLRGHSTDNYFWDDSIFYMYDEMRDEFNIISSSRLNPERTYYQSITSNKVDKFGNGYIDQLLEWSDSQSEKIYELVAILKDLRMLYDIKPHRLSGGRFEIKVKVKSRSKWDSLADVGFGISQFLPIIVADLQLSDASTLIMSQPEIHLHPSVQANLGNRSVEKC